MKMKHLIIIAGPPASGKTTLSSALAPALKATKVSFKSFGLLGFFVPLILLKVLGMYDADYRSSGISPVSLLPKNIRGLRTLLLFNEIIYKCFNWIYVWLNLQFRGCVVVDEGFVIPWANYINLYQYSRYASKKGIKALIYLDLLILTHIADSTKISFIFCDAQNHTLLKRWHRKGRAFPYPHLYADLIRKSMATIDKIVSSATIPTAYVLRIDTSSAITDMVNHIIDNCMETTNVPLYPAVRTTAN